ncbi:MAG: UDPGP type 1 family protein [Sedimentisphaerales bacterium]|nr:UDPGP type 1 family protein [Sedimentisphaerales bacterium]
MISKKTFENIQNLLKKHKQEHLLRFWHELTTPQKQHLLEQIKKLDFSQIDCWAANFIPKTTHTKISADLIPAPAYNPNQADAEQKRKYNKAIELGKKLISTGKVAALVVAGGQGTRLGYDGPKGNFPISPVKNKTLFQLFAETIAAVSKKYQTICPWYIMTSPLNYDQTLEIFRKNGYYGLNEKDVFIFKQGTLPNFSFDGKILMTDKATIACSPDGHGGSLKALYKSGAIEDMKKRGIDFISYWQVDNPLVRIFDHLFIGLHALDRAEMSSIALIKTGPKEKIGIFCLINNKVTAIEYCDLPDEIAEKRNADGTLVFALGSIAIHIINVSFVERINAGGFSLPLHRAIKKIPHIDWHGKLVSPAEPNGIKLESFVFDALPLASKSIILQTLRCQEFAPVKSPTGVDSVETTKQMMIDYTADWLESAAVSVPRKPDGTPDCLLEIAPSFALEKNEVKTKQNQIPKIKPKDELYLS